MISDQILLIKLDEKKETERILLILINGILDNLEQDIISVRTAELAIFGPAMLTERKRKQINNGILDLIYEGLFLENVLDWMPHKFKDTIHNMQTVANTLLKKYDTNYLAKPWIENIDNKNILSDEERFAKLKHIKKNYNKISAIYSDIKEKSEIIILVLICGMIVSLENKLISLDYAKESLFSDSTTDILRSLGLRLEIINLIQKGIELERLNVKDKQLNESSIIEMKNTAYNLLKCYNSPQYLYRIWIRTIRCKKTLCI